MVRGLTVGILHNDSQEKPEITVDQLPRKGANPRVIIDGVSLAYQVLTPESKDHSWEFLNGGNYKQYSTKVLEFVELLKHYALEVVIVFPLAEGTPPISEQSTSRWNQKAVEKLRRVQRARNLLEKGTSTSRTLQEVLPPFIISEITETLKSAKYEVIFTRNNVTRFASKYVFSGKADAVIGQNSDYLIFKGVNYIPLDSIYKNTEQILCFDLLSHDIAAKLIKLEDPNKMFELSVLLGNPFTEPFVVSKYPIFQCLHIKLNPKYPAALVNGIVAFLNNPEFISIEESSPIKEMVQADAEFKQAIDHSREFFNIESELDPEGDSDVVKETCEGKLPLWAPAVFENGDFWYDPVVDDYEHEVKTASITEPLRKFFYSILKRDKVVEHIPAKDSIDTKEVTAEAGFPDYKKLWGMKAKKAKNLEKTYQNIARCLFPSDHKFPDKEPLEKLGEPFITIGLTLRYIVSVCFTDNQASNTLLPENGPEDLKKLKVVGAPPLDLFELKSLAALALILNSGVSSKFSAPSFKPKLRRIKVTAYYQAVIQHLMWLQQLMGVEYKVERFKPSRLYDGEIFAAIYESMGEINSDKFLQYFDDESASKIAKAAEEKLPVFLNAVLAPFPKDIFEAFVSTPRYIASNVFDETKPVQQEVIVVQSKFAGLLNSDDDDEFLEEEDDGMGNSVGAQPLPPQPAPAPAPAASAPPPPPPRKQQKKPAKVEDDDDDMEAFLMAQAAKNASAGGPPKPKTVQQQKPQQKKKPHVRKLEGGMTINNPTFNKESKQEFKRQLKQQGYDYN
ncbi:hypothetical protein M9Y10_034860 [Tritrichomonas musculus]|uniref:XPG N-terminal domain containing protein n=1 Tax=Tritrichomonas musculus TaxID=1915356 RepID=A0ABR2KG53_9EUKA